MRVFVDIDNTICTAEEKYEDCEPKKDRILKINKLFDDGHYIVYWTARGSRTGNNYEKLTLGQFKKWKIKHHEIVFGKPDYDVFIDDKSINSETFFKEL